MDTFEVQNNNSPINPEDEGEGKLRGSESDDVSTKSPSSPWKNQPTFPHPSSNLLIPQSQVPTHRETDNPFLTSNTNNNNNNNNYYPNTSLSISSSTSATFPTASQKLLNQIRRDLTSRSSNNRISIPRVSALLTSNGEDNVVDELNGNICTSQIDDFLYQFYQI